MFQVINRSPGRILPALSILTCVFAFCTLPALAQERLPVNVCEVVSHPEKYKSRIVQIAGALLAGRHGIDLAGRCRNPPSIDSICVVLSGQLNTPQVPFKSDRLPIETLASAERLLREQGTGFSGRAIIEGQVFVAPDQSGFCSNNNYRVMLVAKELISYEVRRTTPESQGADTEKKR